MTGASVLIARLNDIAGDPRSHVDRSRAARYVREGVFALIHSGHAGEALRAEVLDYLDEVLTDVSTGPRSAIWLDAVRSIRAFVATMPGTDTSEPCGSLRVTESVEGHDYRVAWCSRLSGPCPFVGTAEARASDRKCADSPGRRLAVVYSDDQVLAARRLLRDYVDGNPEGPLQHALHIGISAISACLGSEDEPSSKEADGG